MGARRGGRLAWVLVTLASATSAVRAQRGAELVGFDARQAGRGGSDVAVAEDLSALLSNPAGLVQIEDEWRVDLTLRAIETRFSYEDPFNVGGVSSDKLLFAPYLAVAWDPDPGDVGRPGDFRLGLGILHIGGVQNAFDVSTQDYVDPLRTERSTDWLYSGLHLGAAWQLTEELSVGATLSGTFSQLAVTEPFEVPIFQFEGSSPLGTPWGQLLNQTFGLEALRIEGNFESEVSLGGAVTLGTLWKATDALTFGLTWRSPSFQQDYAGEVDVDISGIFAEPDPVTFPNGFAINYDGEIVDFEHPQAIAVGFAWRPREDMRLSAEVRWTDWSSTHASLDIRLRNGDNQGFNDFVGSDSLDLLQTQGWRDQWTAMVGLEWSFAEGWTARSGFLVQNSPVRADEASPSAPAFSTWQVAAGLGYRTTGWAVAVAWQHTFDRDVDVGDSSVSSDLDGSNQGFGTDSVFISLSLFF